MKKPHKHYWHYPHMVWTGRSPDEVAVARYCSCGKKEIAFTSSWQRIPKGHPDVRSTLDNEIEGIQVFL
jgi:phenylpropionate dioxygenase-like ring-hydroxylating dioxygenase large terminal subunit